MSQARLRVDYDQLLEARDYIQSQTSVKPEFGVICGSGLGGLAEQLDAEPAPRVISYSDIPHFPAVSVEGHAGNLVFGCFSGQPTVCMQGRFHCYEGYSVQQVTMPVRVMHLLGVKTLVVTNASGGLNPAFNIGDIMVMKDHINLAGMTGVNPLIGPNDSRFGPRFPALTTAYDKQLRQLILRTAQELGMGQYMREGVYVHITGPNYETPAEARFLHKIGADTVGMSTAPEVIVAKHSGMRVLGLSLVTNKVILDNDTEAIPPTHEEVMETGRKRAEEMQKLVRTTLYKLSTQGPACP
jgi:purine-nucleoside phosphorylase